MLHARQHATDVKWPGIGSVNPIVGDLVSYVSWTHIHKEDPWTSH